MYIMFHYFNIQVYALYTTQGDPIIASTGILVEDKTRRFMVDDKHDLYYRAQVQNRAYLRDIVEASGVLLLFLLDFLLVSLMILLYCFVFIVAI